MAGRHRVLIPGLRGEIPESWLSRRSRLPSALEPPAALGRRKRPPRRRRSGTATCAGAPRARATEFRAIWKFKRSFDFYVRTSGFRAPPARPLREAFENASARPVNSTSPPPHTATHCRKTSHGPSNRVAAAKRGDPRALRCRGCDFPRDAGRRRGCWNFPALGMAPEGERRPMRAAPAAGLMRPRRGRATEPCVFPAGPARAVDVSAPWVWWAILVPVDFTRSTLGPGPNRSRPFAAGNRILVKMSEAAPRTGRTVAPSRAQFRSALLFRSWNGRPDLARPHSCRCPFRSPSLLLRGPTFGRAAM